MKTLRDNAPSAFVRDVAEAAASGATLEAFMADRDMFDADGLRVTINRGPLAGKAGSVTAYLLDKTARVWMDEPVQVGDAKTNSIHGDAAGLTITAPPITLTAPRKGGSVRVGNL